jgi:RNA polymerase sigma-70 factor (ECF subfamily)
MDFSLEFSQQYKASIEKLTQQSIITGERCSCYNKKKQLFLFAFLVFICFICKEGEILKLDAYEKQLLEIINELISYLIKMGANNQDAQDIAQDTIIKILEIEAILPAKMIRPWIFRVGINLYFNLFNRKKKYQEILNLHMLPTHFVTKETDYEPLYHALNQLDQKSANLLLMKYEQNLRIEEMAFVLKRPKESLKTELYRARKKLQTIMEENDK